MVGVADAVAVGEVVASAVAAFAEAVVSPAADSLAAEVLVESGS